MPFTIANRANNADKHSSDIRSLFSFKGKLYSGGEDGKIKMWSESLKLLGTINAHSGFVYSLAASEDTLYSCSNDGTVKSWTLDLKEKETLLKDQTELWKLYYDDNTLFVGSSEGTVKLFVNNKFRSVVNVIEPVGDMVVLEDLIYVVRDFDVVIQEVYPGSKTGFGPKKVIQGRHPLCLIGDKLCFSSRTGKDIMIYESSADFQFTKFAEAKNAHDNSVDALCTVNSYGQTLIYSGGPEKSLKQWKLVGNKIQNQNSCAVDMPINAICAGTKGEIYVGGGGGDLVCVDVQ